MLVNLHVKNMALIRDLDMDFTEGLNILTGETGAGKSILIGSINVALGMQNFRGFAREDSSTALVELVFSTERASVKQWMQEHELPFEDGQLILSRRLTGSRTISKVNEVTVPVSTIRELAALLIDIHGQHEHQSLLYRKNHLHILDEFAGEELRGFREKGREIYREYTRLRTQLSEMKMDEAARKKEIDFLQYELDEISQAELKRGEDEELEYQYRRQVNAQKISQEAGAAYERTSGMQNSASEQITDALQRLNSVGSMDEALESISGQLAEIESLLFDFNRELSGYLSEMTFDAAAFEELTERLNLINHLKSKYGESIEEIEEYAKNSQIRLDELMDYDAVLAALETKFQRQEQLLWENGRQMTKIRRRYAKELSAKIREELKDLNFLNTEFEIELSETQNCTENGCDEACFMMSMNPGSPKKPLDAVASGGELSRIMLAIKTVLADRDQTETLIFDEIDVGISGRTAQKVSEKMAMIAGSRQVLCITHLAQIASMADAHYCIEKNVRDQETETTIRVLESEERKEELARILGGAEITETTMQSAVEMKQLADEKKRVLRKK
ncbi:MAG: DNA repair protein RecN [Eubacteriales bacterium]|nr:DNA repair protein RecN [Eubacteriales bacterium]